MARIRNIKPEFFTNADLAERERASGLPLRVAYAGLWCQADREGRLRWDPTRLKLAILPHDQVDFGAVLEALAEGGYLQRYVVEGRTYATIPTFREHQQVHPREAASKLPAPPSVDNHSDQPAPDAADVPEKADNVQPSPVPVPEKAGNVLPFPGAATAPSSPRQAITTGISGPSERSEEQTIIITGVRERASEMKGLLPADCHDALDRLLVNAQAGAAGVLDQLDGLLAVKPRVVPKGPGMRPVSAEHVGELIVRMSSTPRAQWHQELALGMLEAITRGRPLRPSVPTPSVARGRTTTPARPATKIPQL